MIGPRQNSANSRSGVVTCVQDVESIAFCLQLSYQIGQGSITSRHGQLGDDSECQGQSGTEADQCGRLVRFVLRSRSDQSPKQAEGVGWLEHIKVEHLGIVMHNKTGKVLAAGDKDLTRVRTW
jgi:hypothetical protein